MKVLFFAQLREVTGAREIVMESAEVDAEGLWCVLLSRWPALAPLRSQVRLARNGVYAGEAEVFRPGDEVALIPPVSGG
jgi:molybdopterin converting factor subunit 1